MLHYLSFHYADFWSQQLHLCSFLPSFFTIDIWRFAKILPNKQLHYFPATLKVANIISFPNINWVSHESKMKIPLCKRLCAKSTSRYWGFVNFECMSFVLIELLCFGPTSWLSPPASSIANLFYSTEKLLLECIISVHPSSESLCAFHNLGVEAWPPRLVHPVKIEWSHQQHSCSAWSQLLTASCVQQQLACSKVK